MQSLETNTLLLNTNAIIGCEVCGNQHLKSVLNLGNHPMCDDLIPINDKHTCEEYPIEILLCENCITAHQRFQVPKKILFPSSYHYRSRFTADVLNGMQQLVQACEDNFQPLKDKLVLDIGCNDGSLLDFFKDKKAKTYGIEPTSASEDAKNKGHGITKDFLTEKTAKDFVMKNGHPDIISFTNVFAHIENLNEVVNSLKILKKEETLIVIENHYLGAILEKNQFDTFYHEHPRTYSLTSFEFIAKSLGLTILNAEFPSRYGGNIRIFLGLKKENLKVSFEQEKEREKTFSAQLSNLAEKINIWRKRKNYLLQTLFQKYGPLKAKAFPGRSAILIKLLNLNETMISAVYEKPGSLKIGNYVPGTRIPILSDMDLFNSNSLDDPIINLAWHIPTEIHNYLISNNYSGKIIDILSQGDFAHVETYAET